MKNWKNYKQNTLLPINNFPPSHICVISKEYKNNNNKFANFNILRGTTWSSQCSIKHKKMQYIQHIIYVYFYVLILI